MYDIYCKSDAEMGTSLISTNSLNSRFY